MTRIAVIIGTGPLLPTGIPTLPASDRSALHLAMTRTGAEIDVYGADREALGYARAAGAQSVAALSQTAVRDFDAALIGRGGCGELGDLLPAQLAERHGAALAYEAIDVDVNGGDFLVTRDLGRGARDILRVRAPVVLLIAETTPRGRYVSRHRRDAARAEFDDCIDPGESPVRWEPTRPRVRLGNRAMQLAAPATDRMNALFGLHESRGRPAQLVRGGGEECARRLLDYLARHGFLDGDPADEFRPPWRADENARPAGDTPEPSLASSGPPPAGARRRPRRAGGARGERRGPVRIDDDPKPEEPTNQQ